MVSVRLLPLPLKNRFVLAIRVVLVEVAVSARLKAGVSASPMVNGTVRGVSSSVAWALRLEIVGEVFIPVTVTVNRCVVWWFCGWPSSTVTVMVAVPVALLAGRRSRAPTGLGFV